MEPSSSILSCSSFVKVLEDYTSCIAVACCVCGRALVAQSLFWHLHAAMLSSRHQGRHSCKFAYAVKGGTSALGLILWWLSLP